MSVIRPALYLHATTAGLGSDIFHSNLGTCLNQSNNISDTLRRVRFEKTGGTPESSNTPTSPISTCTKEDVNDVISGNGDEHVVVPISGNGSVKNNVNNSTFKSPPHHVHSHPSSELEADTRM